MLGLLSICYGGLMAPFLMVSKSTLFLTST